MEEKDLHEHVHAEGCDCDECQDDCDCCGEEGIFEFEGENGETLRFAHIGTLEYQNKFYAAFEPAEEIPGIEEGQIFIYEVKDIDKETSDLVPVEDEKLLDEVFEEFCKALEEDDCDCDDCHHHHDEE